MSVQISSHTVTNVSSPKIEELLLKWSCVWKRLKVKYERHLCVARARPHLPSLSPLLNSTQMSVHSKPNRPREMPLATRVRCKNDSSSILGVDTYMLVIYDIGKLWYGKDFIHLLRTVHLAFKADWSKAFVVTMPSWYEAIPLIMSLYSFHWSMVNYPVNLNLLS